MGERSRIGEWDVVLIRQVDWPPFLPWCAFATRKAGNKIYGFNVEGTDKADALRRVHLRLLERGSNNPLPGPARG
jgi:hypothetical protein